MAKPGPKKRPPEEQSKAVALKLPPSDLAQLEQIAEIHSLKPGTVARLMVVRGLNAYQRDLQLTDLALVPRKEEALDPETRQREAMKKLIHAKAKTTPDKPTHKPKRKVSGE